MNDDDSASRRVDPMRSAGRRLAKWFYQGGRPNQVAAMLNYLGATVYALGVAPNYLATLEVVGRTARRK